MLSSSLQPRTVTDKNRETERVHSFSERFLSKFVVKLILEIPAHLAYVATLPCETLMPAKQATNDKFQGNVAIHIKVWWGC